HALFAGFATRTPDGVAAVDALRTDCMREIAFHLSRRAGGGAPDALARTLVHAVDGLLHHSPADPQVQRARVRDLVRLIEPGPAEAERPEPGRGSGAGAQGPDSGAGGGGVSCGSGAPLTPATTPRARISAVAAPSTAGSTGRTVGGSSGSRNPALPGRPVA